MTLPIIEELKRMLTGLYPIPVFECDMARMLNVKVDTMERYRKDDDGNVLKDERGNPVSNDFIYIEEPTQGYYDIPYAGFQRQRLPLMIYFCKFEPMANDAYRGDTPFSHESPTTARLELRDQIERDFVRPFLYRLRTSRIGRAFPSMFESVRVVYPSPRFDANEVSVGIELTVWTQWCIDAYRPDWSLVVDHRQVRVRTHRGRRVVIKPSKV